MNNKQRCAIRTVAHLLFWGDFVKKKIIIAVISVLSTIIIFIAVSIGLFVYNTEYKLALAGTENSPDGKYTVIFQMVGNPDWPFGSTAVKVTVKETEGNKIVKVIDTSIDDDGAKLREDNWDVVWQDDSVKIILKGSEHEDAVHTVMLQ